MPRPDDTVELCAEAVARAAAAPRRPARPVPVADLAAAERMLRVLRGLGYRDRTLAVLGPGRFAVSWR